MLPVFCRVAHSKLTHDMTDQSGRTLVLIRWKAQAASSAVSADWLLSHPYVLWQEDLSPFTTWLCYNYSSEAVSVISINLISALKGHHRSNEGLGLFSGPPSCPRSFALVFLCLVFVITSPALTTRAGQPVFLVSKLLPGNVFIRQVRWFCLWGRYLTQEPHTIVPPLTNTIQSQYRPLCLQRAH